MLSLFRAEVARFRWPAIGIAIVYFGTLLFFDRVTDLLQQPKFSFEFAGGVNALIGIALGLFQAGSTTKPSPWMMLVHRPIAPGRIALALVGGAMAVLAIALVTPAAGLVVAHGLMGEVVDARHWGLPVAGWLLGLIGYLAGVIVVIAPRRYGWLALFPAALPALAAATGGGALLFQALVALALGAVVLILFQPDREAPPRSLAASGWMAAMVAFGAYAVLTVIGDIAFQTAWIVTGTHPLNSKPPVGGVIEATRADGDALIDQGLAMSRDPQALLWREQAKLSEIVTLQPAYEEMPTRGELTNIAPMQLEDKENGVRWTFSHDDMRFHGRRIDDRLHVGTMGIGETGTPFPAPPLAGEDGLVMSAESIDRFDAIDRRIYRRAHLPQGESIAAPPAPAGEAIALLSDHALRLYDARVVEEGDRLHPAYATIPLPAPVGSLMRIDRMELMDGDLLSFTYGREMVSDPGIGWQQIYVRDGQGRLREVARRTLRPDFPTAARYAKYWVSPAIKRAQGLVLGSFAGRAPLKDKAPDQVPWSMKLLAGLLMVGAAGAVALIARRRGFAPARLAGWSLAALLIGMPMAIAFWLIRPRSA